ncbi:hypothetical protein MRX96_057965 [Rhipicephalus microplus]
MFKVVAPFGKRQTSLSGALRTLRRAKSTQGFLCLRLPTLRSIFRNPFGSSAQNKQISILFRCVTTGQCERRRHK